MAIRRKNPRDQDLRDAVSLISSASAKEAIRKTRFMPADKEEQNRYGELLVSWSRTDEAEDIDDFFADMQVGSQKFFRACENNEFLQECLDIADSNVANRLRQKVKDSHEYTMKTLPYYSSKHKQERREKLNAMKEEKQDKEFTITVNRG